MTETLTVIQTVDSKGLITADREGLQEHKKCTPLSLCHVHITLTSRLVFARTDYDGPKLTNLVDIIHHVKPTALLGLSTIKVCRVRALPSSCSRPCRTRSQRTSSRPCLRSTRAPSSFPSPTRSTSASSTIQTPSHGAPRARLRLPRSPLFQDQRQGHLCVRQPVPARDA